MACNIQHVTLMKSSPDLQLIQKHIFEANGLKCSDVSIETESVEYQACSFKVAGRSILYRKAKITPTKNGQFVTLWKRNSKGPIRPYEGSDKIDFVFVVVKSHSNFGLFIFPKEALIQHAIFSDHDMGGKRAIRVYPPWDKPASQQAEKTQQWQLDYFLDIPKTESIDSSRFRSLFPI